jgi:hypothetical protein
MSRQKYPDEQVIAQVEAAMREHPEMSRRAAILQIVGEDSLRRIEMKMTADRTRYGAKHSIIDMDPTRRAAMLHLFGEDGMRRIEMKVAAERAKHLIVVDMDFESVQMRAAIDQFFAGSKEKMIACADRDLDVAEANRLKRSYLARLRERAITVGTMLTFPFGMLAAIGTFLVKLLYESEHRTFVFLLTIAAIGCSFLFVVGAIMLVPSLLASIVIKGYDHDPKRRYVLTDAALYEFWLDDGVLKSKRVPAPEIPAAEITKDGVRVGVGDNALLVRDLTEDDFGRVLLAMG